MATDGQMSQGTLHSRTFVSQQKPRLVPGCTRNKRISAIHMLSYIGDAWPRHSLHDDLANSKLTARLENKDETGAYSTDVIHVLLGWATALADKTLLASKLYTD